MLDRFAGFGGNNLFKIEEERFTCVSSEAGGASAASDSSEASEPWYTFWVSGVQVKGAHNKKVPGKWLWTITK